jgi:hypothetical protein
LLDIDLGRAATVGVFAEQNEFDQDDRVQILPSKANLRVYPFVCWALEQT